MRLHLVRHGRVLVDPTVASTQWSLDPAGLSEVAALRSRLPVGARFVSSTERNAIESARLLTDGQLDVDDDLRECERTWVADPAEFRAAVRRTFCARDEPALPGWETGNAAARRVARAVRRIADDGGAQAVLVGHGTAWTLFVALVAGTPVTIEDWDGWAMPDLRVVEWDPNGQLASHVLGEIGE